MNLKFFNWNVRGVNSEEKRGLVRRAIQQWRADICVLVKTKLTENETQVYRQLWKNRWMGECHLNAIGRSGGIVVMWDKRYCRGVYASCDTVARSELWQELINIKEACNGPWVSCSDYNVTRYPNERSEGNRITGAMNS
ncbi:hypothetical protein H5410_048927 [Solanum commersonii]|uniref:Uncharacterized protein n=1 Tax=Solanum commersonii TaxID=4109 RepID=A0A9J5XKY5_SOLCO|nr:hypothetical protein H5410_048927 [Solanum commersonii]